MFFFAVSCRSSYLFVVVFLVFCSYSLLFSFSVVSVLFFVGQFSFFSCLLLFIMSDVDPSEKELISLLQESLDIRARQSPGNRYKYSFTYLYIRWVDETPVEIALKDIVAGPRRSVTVKGIQILKDSIMVGAGLLGDEWKNKKMMKKGPLFVFCSVFLFVCLFLHFCYRGFAEQISLGVQRSNWPDRLH